MKQLHFINDTSLITEKENILSLKKNNKAFIGSIVSLKKGADNSIKSLKSSLELRLKEGLPTVIEKIGLSQQQIKELELIALKNETNYFHTKAEDFKFIFNTVPDEIELDIIGDIHGLYDNFLKIMFKLGYDIYGRHPKGKKMLFLGDIIDRGPDSIKMIRLVKRLVESGHFAIIGNHEYQLIQNIDRYRKNKKPVGSYAVLKTFKEFLRERDRDDLYKFLKTLPAYYIQKDIAFCHGDIRIFNPLSTTLKEYLYGVTERYGKGPNGDRDYQDNFNKGINKYTLIRGHIIGENKFKNVFSLEFQQSFAGNIAALCISTFNKSKSFEQALTLEKCTFNFKNVNNKG